MTFGALTVVLLLTTLFQVRFGLAPLKRISEALVAIRAGKAERLEGRFPDEIAPLARETNALIEANREIVERARTHVGNLAHALKTPLSVIVNEAASRADPFSVKVRGRPDSVGDRGGGILGGRASRRAPPWWAASPRWRRWSRRSPAPWRRSIAIAVSPSTSTRRNRRAFAASARISRR